MNSQLSSTEPTQPAISDAGRRRLRKRVMILALIVALLGAAAGWLYDRMNERPRVLAAIEAEGGKYQAPK